MQHIEAVIIVSEIYIYHTIYYICTHFLNKITYSIKQKYFVKYIFPIIISKKKKHVLNIFCIIFVQKYYMLEILN